MDSVISIGKKQHTQKQQLQRQILKLLSHWTKER